METDNILLSNKKTIGTKLVYISLAVYLLAILPDYSMFGQFEFLLKAADVLKLISLVLLGINFVLGIKEYSKKKLILLFAVGAFSVISCYKSGSMAPVLLIAFWTGIGNTKYDEILKIYFVILLAEMIIVLGSFAIGLLPDYIHYGGHSLGFSHPNAMGRYLMIEITIYLAMRGDKVKWFDWVICAALSVALYCCAKGEAALIVSLLAVFISIAEKKGWITFVIEKCEWICAALVPALMTVLLTITEVADLESGFWQKINSLSTGRLQLGQTGLRELGIPAFGQKVVWSTGYTDEAAGIYKPYNIVDSSYIHIPIVYGFFYTFIIVVLYAVFGYYIGKKRNNTLIAIFLVIAVHSIAEGTLTDIPFNPILIMLGYVFSFVEKDYDSIV